MVRGSIRWRLSAIAAIAIAGALTLSATGLTILFDRQVTRLTRLELEARVTTLVAGLDQNDLLKAPLENVGGDPRYLQPYSGLYWQIELAGRTYRSQSLWDTVLAVEAVPPSRGSPVFYEADGPDGQRLLVLDSGFQIGAQALVLRVSVAESRAALDDAEAQFKRDLLPFLIALGAMMTAGSAAQVAFGLRPFARIRRQIEEMSLGQRPRLGTEQPAEVRPLANAIDELLEDRDARIAKARTRAMDLAHTLKTPLQALMGETGRLRDRGEIGAADTIDGIVATVRARMDRELARARIGGGGIADVLGTAEKVVMVLARTAKAEGVTLSVDVPAGLVAHLDENDLIEALGSVAENALHYAKTKVAITGQADSGQIKISIEDDGAGVPPGLLARIRDRGVRLDETLDGAGTGIGLSLAYEIVEAAGGEVTVKNLAPGFRVVFTLRTAG